MVWLWSWSGQFVGYRQGDDLWTCDGRHSGRFAGSEVYGPDGCYLGQMAKEDRLVTRKARLGLRRGAFAPVERVGLVSRRCGVPPYALPQGYQDFANSGFTPVSSPPSSRSLQCPRRADA